MEIKNITEEEFYEASNRVQNHIDKNAGFDGFMYETNGEVLANVFEMSKLNQVVTIVEGEEFKETFLNQLGVEIKEMISTTNLYYASGCHSIIRLGYFVLDNPYEFEFEVKVD
jgi:hypothetical protein